MKFSEFYSLLKKEIPDCRALQGNDCELYSFKPANVAEQFEDGLLYALYLQNEGFALDPVLSSGRSFILSGNEIQFDHLKMADRSPDTNILFVTGYTLVNLFNIISDIFLRENRFTSQLHDLYGIASSGAGLQVLVDKAQEMLMCPIVVMDNSYRIMAISLGNLGEDEQGLQNQQEMGNIMRTLGKNFSNQELNSIIQEIEIKGKGFIELDKFIELMAHNKIDENTLKIEQTNLINAFKYFDRDQTGLIDYEEFKHILQTVSEKLTQDEIKSLDELCLSQVDENGKFNYRDFLDLIILRS